MSKRWRRWLGTYRRSFLGRWGELVGAIVLMAAFPLYIVASGWGMQERERELWKAPGPPCPTAAVLLKNRPGHPPRSFRFQELEVTRLAGDVECRAFSSRNPFDGRTHTLCQFALPVMLAVTAGGQTRIFDVGVGRAATVEVRDGRPDCHIVG